jgi:diguanylate cyclase (GGDEF)-like protein
MRRIEAPPGPSVRVPPRFEADIEAQFLESRAAGLMAVNMNTFWTMAIIVMGFGAWDLYVDPLHWRLAFSVRLVGTIVIVATGIFQKLPGNAQWMPLLAKVRLVIAVVTSAIAGSMLDAGYGFDVAGLVVIILTGPYIALDRRDLLKMNAAAMLSLVPVMFVISLDRFDTIGTGVFVFLAVTVSSLLGRVLETSNRRAFALELELHHDARTDSLTGLNNRRAIEERGPIELKRASRSGKPVSVVMSDLDHFKRINDKYGHEAGDAALAKVAAALQETLRETDALGRWGGEEFIAVLAATDGPTAVEVAERMRLAVAATPLDGVADRLTISLGVATLGSVDTPATDWDALVKAADRHMYRAKSEGRNRVVSLAPGHP